MNKKLYYYLKFIFFFTICPTTFTFWLLQNYTQPIFAYLIANIFWATVIYFLTQNRKGEKGVLEDLISDKELGKFINTEFEKAMASKKRTAKQ